MEVLPKLELYICILQYLLCFMRVDGNTTSTRIVLYRHSACFMRVFETVSEVKGPFLKCMFCCIMSFKWRKNDQHNVNTFRQL